MVRKDGGSNSYPGLDIDTATLWSAVGLVALGCLTIVAGLGYGLYCLTTHVSWR